MSVLSLFRKDRRQRDPFTALPETGPAGPATAPIPLSWTPEVERQLAGIVAQAEAERAAHAEDWYGLTELDNPPAHDRPYVPALTAVLAATTPAPLTPVTAAESASRMARLTYPAPDATREQYAACMRQVSAWTGTRSGFDWPAAWTSARPGPAEVPVTCWTPQRAPLLAIEAPREVAA